MATEEKAHIEELFKTFDSNKDGKLSNTGKFSSFNLNLSKLNVFKFFFMYTKELNDVICSCFNIKHETLNDEKLVKMRNKLKKILNLMGIKITEDIDLETFKKIISEVQINSVFEDEDTQVNNIFNYFNTNNDGVLTKNELMVGMSKLEISMSEYDAIEMFDGAGIIIK